MKYGTIIADPPWNYTSSGTNSRLFGYADRRYDLLTHQDLCDMDVESISQDEAVLFLWTTNPFVANGQAMEVARAWGFEPVTFLTWVKTTREGNLSRGGVGYWFRGTTELVLVARKGKAYRWSGHPDWTSYDASGSFPAPVQGHSRKPDTLHERVERSIYPKPYLEIFGRRARDGWTVIGNESPETVGEDIRESIKRLAES